MDTALLYLVGAATITAGLLVAAMITLYLMQKREFKESNLELKQIQLENLRFIQQMERNNEKRQQENEKFFRGLSYSVGQIYLNLGNDPKE